MSSRLQKTRLNARQRRLRTRAKIRAVSQRPRLNVHVSLRHIRAQVIDDSNGRVLAAVSSLKRGWKEPLSQQAQLIGTEIAQKCKQAKVKEVVFDRGKRAYGQRLRHLTEAARKEGLKF